MYVCVCVCVCACVYCNRNLYPRGKDCEMRQFCVAITQFTVLLFCKVPLQTALHCRFPPSQQYDRWQIEYKGSSSLHAMEPSATGLQQVRTWTDATLVQSRNAFVIYFLAFTVGRGRRCLVVLSVQPHWLLHTGKDCVIWQSFPPGYRQLHTWF